MNDKLQLFENQRIRSAWDNENEKWYFSIVDVVGALTDVDNPRRYRKTKTAKRIGTHNISRILSESH